MFRIWPAFPGIVEELSWFFYSVIFREVTNMLYNFEGREFLRVGSVFSRRYIFHGVRAI